jgi:hypothetical protein
MTEQSKKDRPDYRCSLYNKMSRAWGIVKDASEGTLELRAKASQYLPKFPAEDDNIYKDRRDTATFFNATTKTKGALVGLIFRKPPKLSEHVPEVIKKHLENVDSVGTHWTVFTKEFTDSAVELGHSIIFVDMQLFKEGATHEDDFAPGNRPFWIRYTPEQAINWRMAKRNGQMVLQQITFEECSTEADGEFGEKIVTRYRVLRLTETVDGQTGETTPIVQWKLYLKVKDEHGNEVVIPENEGTFKNIREIPISVGYGGKKDFLYSRPPLLDLALMNIKHFQQASDYDNTLHICGFPILCDDNAGNEEDVKPVGPALKISVEKGGQVWYAEPAGSSLAAQRQNLEDKKQEMAAMGISFLAEKVQVEQTATEQKINSSERTSDLATIARSVKDAIERALGFHAQFLGMRAEQAGTIEIADPAELVLSIEQIREMSDEVVRGQQSLETFWAMKAKAGLLPDDFDPELERERIGEVQPI